MSDYPNQAGQSFAPQSEGARAYAKQMAAQQQYAPNNPSVQPGLRSKIEQTAQALMAIGGLVNTLYSRAVPPAPQAANSQAPTPNPLTYEQMMDLVNRELDVIHDKLAEICQHI